MTPQGTAPVVIVTTIQSYRVKDDRSGDEVEANRRIYRDNGYLMRPFENLPSALRARLAEMDRQIAALPQRGSGGLRVAQS